MSDSIDLIAALAFKQHEEGKITKEQLVRQLQLCINARAIGNGYADEFGMPFPEAKFDEQKG